MFGGGKKPKDIEVEDEDEGLSLSKEENTLTAH